MVYRTAPPDKTEKLRSHVLDVGRAVGSTFKVPPLGRLCVCCNADTYGRNESFDPSTDRIRADNVEVPVCGPCKNHALASNTRTILTMCGGLLGLTLIGLGFAYRNDRPNDTGLLWFIAFGAALFVIATIVGVRAWRANKAHESRGHHPGFHIAVGSDRTLLSTTNADFADRLLQSGLARRIR